MTDEAMETWSSLLSEVAGAVRDDERDGDLTLFYTSVGSQYDGELMVVGRAVNGWVPRFKSADLASDRERRALVKAEHARLAAQECQMAWVSSHWQNRTGYNTAGSAFWRVIRGVTEGLGGGRGPWPARLAWSNLYRVSPFEAGNPPAHMRRAQMAMSARLLEADFRQHRPRRVLFLTGLDWLHAFRGELDLDLAVVGADGVDASGGWGNARVVVAKHPQGKRERPMVDRINHLLRG